MNVIWETKSQNRGTDRIITYFYESNEIKKSSVDKIGCTDVSTIHAIQFKDVNSLINYVSHLAGASNG